MSFLRPLLDVLAIPAEHNLIGWMLVGGVAEVSVLFSIDSGSPTNALQMCIAPRHHKWHGSFSHCPGAPFAGTLVLDLAWFMVFNTAVYLWFYRRDREGWRVSVTWLNVFT
jgi:hypothetical protein